MVKQTHGRANGKGSRRANRALPANARRASQVGRCPRVSINLFFVVADLASQPQVLLLLLLLDAPSSRVACSERVGDVDQRLASPANASRVECVGSAQSRRTLRAAATGHRAAVLRRREGGCGRWVARDALKKSTKSTRVLTQKQL